MLKHIKHGIALVKHSLRDVGVLQKRSGEWPRVEKEFLEAHPICAACGGNKHLNVHHIKPFHTFPEHELDPNNLITLCMSKSECHVRLGHCGNYKLYNPNVKEDAAEALKNPNKFDEIVKRAAENFKKN